MLSFEVRRSKNLLMHSSLFSKKRDDWPTAWSTYNRLDKIFGFTRDVCASKRNAKHKNYWTKRDRVLTRNWDGVNFMNNPYSQTFLFIRKARIESMAKRATTVALVASRTDSEWWHEFVWDNESKKTREGVIIWEFIQGREIFEGAIHGAPFPSVILVFDGGPKCQKSSARKQSKNREKSL